MTDWIIWFLIGNVPFWATWLAWNYLRSDYAGDYGRYPDRRRKFCDSVTPFDLYLLLFFAVIWPITVVLGIILWCIILYDVLDQRDFWSKELFNPCDLFRRK